METKISSKQLGEEPRIWYKVPGYVIRNCTPDLAESVVHHMITYFLDEEPFCSTSKVTSDPLSLKEVTEWWQSIMSREENLTVIALPEGAPGADLKPVTEKIIPLAGVNVLLLARKTDPPLKPVNEMFLGTAARRSIGPYFAISKKLDCFKKYGVEMFMDAAGLSVHPNYRKRGLGDGLLQARFELCRALGVRVTKTLFSSIPAQKVALRNGMEIAYEVLYGDLKDDTGGPAFPGMPSTNRVLLTVRSDLCD